MDQAKIAEKLQVIHDGINTEGDLISQIITALEGKGNGGNVNNNLPFILTGDCIYGDKFIATGELSSIGPGECYDYNIPENTNVILLFKWIVDFWAPASISLVKNNGTFHQKSFGTDYVFDKYDDGTVLRFVIEGEDPSYIFLIPLYLPPKEEV